MLPDILRPAFRTVFSAFPGPEDGFVSARDQTLHHFRIRTVGGRAFHSIQDAEPPGRSAPHIKKTAARAEMFRDKIHGPGDFRQDLFYGESDLLIFLIDDPHDIQR